MYICDRCGAVTEDVPVTRWRHTELEGDYYEREAEPCLCGGEFVEAVECDRCGEYASEDELVNGWCRICVAELCEARGLDVKRDASEIYDIIEDGEYE